MDIAFWRATLITRTFKSVSNYSNDDSMEPLNLGMYKLPNPVSMTDDTTDSFFKNHVPVPANVQLLHFFVSPVAVCRSHLLLVFRH
jgi:hypothetical protein